MPDSLLKLTSGRQIVEEYSIKRMVLAFCVGQKQNSVDIFPSILTDLPTIFSKGGVDSKRARQASNDNDSTASVTTPLPPPPSCKQHKYAPRKWRYRWQSRSACLLYKKNCSEQIWDVREIVFFRFNSLSRFTFKALPSYI